MARKVLFYSLLLLSILGVCISGYKILTIVMEYKAGEQTYEQVQDLVQIPSKPANENSEQYMESAESTDPSGYGKTYSEEKQEEFVYPEVDFTALQALSDDVVGWIYIPDTEINYPIVQGDDNDFYLTAMIDGSHNSAGSIFMDYRNASDFSDRHTILYGHNMGNGTMFAGITKYRNQAFYDAHPIGAIVTPDTQLIFEVVAGYVATTADSSWQLEFEEDAEALEWVQAAMKRSAFRTRYQPQLQDRMITLSTCSYEMENARFVVVGILAKK